jgi:hypothetical protein
MASISLFASSSTESYAISATQKTSQQDTQNAVEAEDSVKLSDAAQAKALYHEGQSVTAIAASLGTTAKQVNDYLGIALEEELAQALQATLKA